MMFPSCKKSAVTQPSQGVQRRTILVVNFVRIFEIRLVCFVVAICDLVQDVEAILSVSLTDNSIWKSLVKYANFAVSLASLILQKRFSDDVSS